MNVKVPIFDRTKSLVHQMLGTTIYERKCIQGVKDTMTSKTTSISVGIEIMDFA